MKTMTRSEFEGSVSKLLDTLGTASDSVLIVSDGQPVFQVDITPLPSARLETNALLREQLRGSLLSFDDPTAPVGVEDWQALH
jgi:hypothetical protein